MKNFIHFTVTVMFIAIISIIGCGGGGDTTNNTAQPVLDDLTISATDLDYIQLQKPTLINNGEPDSQINAYIGLKGEITVNGDTIANSEQGPVDVSNDGYKFSSLTAGTDYDIVVVASNNKGYSVKQISQSTGSISPVMNNLVISDSSITSIKLDKPTYSTTGNPIPMVSAYIGIDGVISISGKIITNSLIGPINLNDVSSSSYEFNGLSPKSIYRIVVIAQNKSGYSVKEIVQSTENGIAPILKNLTIGNTDIESITVNRPTFDVAGNPIPQVWGYIGINGFIGTNGNEVIDYIQGPIDLSEGDYQFSSLPINNSFKIIVIAQNPRGYSVKEIIQSTDQVVPPVLNNLIIENCDISNITIAKPTLSVTGNPLPSIQCYIGLNGTITLNDTTVNNFIQGPIDLSNGSFQFNSLLNSTAYKLIVVAKNSGGYSTKEIIQSTDSPIAPELNDLVIQSFDNTSITINKPTLNIEGNPLSTIEGYIGIDGNISINGSTVTNYLQGPVDLSNNNYTFNGLIDNVNYKIIVVAKNSFGCSVKGIVQLTSSIRLRMIASNLSSGNYQNYDQGHGLRIMQGIRPDVVLIQEFNYGNNGTDLQKFANLIIYQTETPVTNAYYYREADSLIPNGIISKYPIISSGEWDDSSSTNRDFAWAKIDIPGTKELFVVSLHLLTSSEANRRTEASQLIQYINNNSILIGNSYLAIGGDFNSDSSTESCYSEFDDKTIVTGPYPADKNSNIYTNASRTKRYDGILVSNDLNTLTTPVIVGSSSFVNGTVIDTRIYDPINEILPALVTDSGASNMQHMCVVKDFLISQ